MNLIKTLITITVLGLAVPTVAAAQEVIFVDTTYHYFVPAGQYETQSVVYDDFAPERVSISDYILRSTRSMAFRAATGTRRVASKATRIVLDYHPAARYAQKKGWLNRQRLLQWVSGD